MRLCFIATQGGEYGGSEVLWYMTAKEALLQNIRVLISAHVSYLAHPQLDELISLGAEIHIRYDAALNHILHKVSFKIRCYLPWMNVFSEIKLFNPDMIIVSQRGTYDAAFQLMLYKFLIRRKFPYTLISQAHEENKVEMPPIHKDRVNRLFQAARMIYFVSNRNKLASEATIGYKIKNATVINNPIKFSVNELEWPKKDTFNIACVARINFQVKRQHLLVDIIAQEKWRNRNVILNIFGDGPDTAALVHLIISKNLQKHVIIHGQVENIKQVWEHNHIFILPSVAEGLPLALIEANILGRAAITTKVGDNKRLVLQGVTGFLIQDLSEQALEQALEEAWREKHKWEEFGNNARKHALENLDINIHKTLLSQILPLVNE